MFTTIALILATFYGYGLTFAMHTKNFASAVVFKFTPFTMSTVALVALILAHLEWLRMLV